MEELVRLAKKSKFDDVESGWMQALEGDAVPWEGLLEVAEVLVRRKRADLAESLVWYLVTQLKERKALRAALAAASRGCTLIPESDMMRDEVKGLYPQVHGGAQTSEALLEMTLGDRSMPLDVAVRRLESLQRLTPGTYVRADPAAKLGRVERLDAERGRLIIAFEEGTREYDAASVERLALVEPNDLRALAIFERDRLAALAKENPEELIALALNTFGKRVEPNRLRLYVEPVLGTTTWSKWWASVKRIALDSPVIGLTEGKPSNLFLRSRPVRREERLRVAFEAATIADRLAIALKVLDETTQDADARRELLEHLGREIAGLLDAPADISRGDALAVLAVLDLIERHAPDVSVPPHPSAERWIEGEGLAEVLCSGLGEGRLLTEVLEALRRWLPERWRDVYARAMVRLPRTACESVAKHLADDGAWDAVAGAVREMSERPDCSAGALAWLWKACSSEGFGKVLADVDRVALLRRLLAAAASLGHAASGDKKVRQREVSQIRQVLLGGDKRALREAIENADADAVASILGLAERNSGLRQPARDELVRIIRACRPSLFRDQAPPWEDTVIYTTAAGIEKRRAQLDQIVKVRLPQVIKEIGAAARFGDLSENAEFTAAVEERGRLAKLSTGMQEELLRARPIGAETAASSHVNVGSRVQARNLQSGEIETLTFLGPWDADPAAGVYSYKAPLGLAFMGHRVGDKVTLRMDHNDERAWEIVEIAPAV